MNILDKDQKTNQYSHFCFALLLLLIHMAFSQVTKASESVKVPLKHLDESSALWELVSQLNQQLHFSMRPLNSVSSEAVHSIFSSTCELSPESLDKVNILLNKAEIERQKTGLEFRGGYSTDDITSDEGRDSTAYLELSWDVLRNGYLESRDKALAFEQHARLEKLSGKEESRIRQYRCQRFQVYQLFTQIYTRLLDLKLALMEPVYKIERRAYFKGWSHLDDFLVADQDLRVARTELAYLNIEPASLGLTDSALNPPIIDINIQKLIEQLQSNDTNKEIMDLKKKALISKNQSREDKRFRLFLRKNLNIQNNVDDSLIAGFRFQIPLESNSAINNQQTFQQRKLENDHRLDSIDKISRTRLSYLSLREAKERVIRQQFRYLRALEKVRRIQIKKDQKENAHIAVAVIRTRSLLDAAINLVKAKQALYQNVLRVFNAAQINYQTDLILNLNIPDKHYRARSGERAVYIWSKAFNKYDNPLILHMLKSKNLNRVILSAGKRTEKEKLKQFISLCHDKGIQVELMTGDNSWIFPEKHDQALLNSLTTAELSNWLHLDIEPHTLENYKANKQAFLNHYVEMLEKINSNLDDTKLAISIPLHWPEHIYQRIAKLTDRIYLMSYGNTDQNKLSRRIKRVLPSLEQTNVIIALNRKDFNDEWQMEQMIDALGHSTGIQHYALHQLNTLIDNKRLSQ